MNSFEALLSTHCSNTKSLNCLQDFKGAQSADASVRILVPGYLSSKFVKRYEKRDSLRDSVNKLIVPFLRTNFMKNSFSYSGAVLWSSLPCDMREAKSLTQFKRLAHLIFRFFKSTVYTAFMKNRYKLF